MKYEFGKCLPGGLILTDGEIACTKPVRSAVCELPETGNGVGKVKITYTDNCSYTLTAMRTESGNTVNVEVISEIWNDGINDYVLPRE